MSTTKDYSDTVLAEVETRTTTLLSAIGRTPAIQAALGMYGWDEAEKKRGWTLFLKAMSYESPSGVVGVDPIVAGAQKQLDETDESTLAIAQASLEAEFPRQAEYVFDGLEPARGVQAINVIRTFLDRIDGLESSPERKATREQDAKAVALLAKRGIDENRRRELRELVGTAEGIVSASPGPLVEDGTDRRAALVDLKRWYDQWATIAKVAIPRRDLLIRLGLASPKRSGGRGDDD